MPSAIIDNDLRKQGSFWRCLTDDLGLSAADVVELETALSGNSQVSCTKIKAMTFPHCTPHDDLVGVLQYAEDYTLPQATTKFQTQ